MNLTTASDLEGRWNRNGRMTLKDEVGLSIREREKRRENHRVQIPTHRHFEPSSSQFLLSPEA